VHEPFFQTKINKLQTPQPENTNSKPVAFDGISVWVTILIFFAAAVFWGAVIFGAVHKYS
jgi:hypothetical protein